MRLRTAGDLGAFIRDRRTASGLSQQALADRCGVSKRWVVAVEAGKSGAEIGLVLRVVAALGFDLHPVPAEGGGAADLDAFLDDLDDRSDRDGRRSS